MRVGVCYWRLVSKNASLACVWAILAVLRLLVVDVDAHLASGDLVADSVNPLCTPFSVDLLRPGMPAEVWFSVVVRSIHPVAPK